MNILFTGGSSFTGYWFAKELAAAGHAVCATFTRDRAESYDGIRGERVRRLLGCCRPVFNCRFGDESFIALIRGAPAWDLLCHHAAEVRDYKSPSFDIHAALRNNTSNLARVLGELGAMGCRAVVLTGSVFENDEGDGSGDTRAFSPYGLSKGLTYQVFRYYCDREGFRLGKFVIPNPFGPFEERRFTSSLVLTWARGERAVVRTPAYVRDNIHVSLLAAAYCAFASRVASATASLLRINPRGYAESQGEFTARFSGEMRERLGLPCEFELGVQKEFPEPAARINTDPAKELVPAWSEERAWDDLARYYREYVIPMRSD